MRKIFWLIDAPSGNTYFQCVVAVGVSNSNSVMVFPEKTMGVHLQCPLFTGGSNCVKHSCNLLMASRQIAVFSSMWLKKCEEKQVSRCESRTKVSLVVLQSSICFRLKQIFFLIWK